MGNLYLISSNFKNNESFELCHSIAFGKRKG